MAIKVAKLEALAFAALRIVTGAMFSFHGMQKLLGWPPSPFHPPLGSQMWFGGIIELVGGVLVALGLFTRPLAILASGTMAVAYTQFHWKLATHGLKWLPVMNQGELALLYSFTFLFIAAHGPGLVSLDWRLRHRS